VKFSDFFIAFVVIGIILLIIFPLTPFFLDVLLIVNVSLSIIILLTTLYTKEPLEFSIFPSMLLLTTLYRLALNISSTRLILSEGEAGQLIETFGNYVIRGNVAVGFVIFIIIVIVQFIVITKGAERVAEVAARFTLDSMPGKQMAVDADLNSGLIDEHEAKRRRHRVQREADFYGAMDGASKFVKGDAVVGIIITIINIVGGLIIGMLMGTMTMQQVIERYTLLTVGDGLVSQIPALILSTASGIIVTRAASDSDLGTDLVKQITAQPITLNFAAVLLGIMAFFPGFPSILLLVVASILGFLGFSLSRATKSNSLDEKEEPTMREADELRKPENVFPLLQVDPIEIEFGYGLIPLADASQGGDLLDRVVMMRRQIAMDIGLVVPVVRLRDNIQLGPNEYIIKIKGVEAAKGNVLPDHYMAMDPGTADGNVEGFETIEPAFGLPAKWIREEFREQAEMRGFTVVDAPSVISTHLTEVIKRFGHEMLGRQEVQAILDGMKQKYSALIEEVVPKIISVGELHKVLANLIRENVSIRDMATILETIADYGNITRNTDILTEYVRQALSRAITARFMPERIGKVLTIEPDLEKVIADSVQQTEHGSYLSLDPIRSQRILKNLNKEVEKMASIGLQPIVLTSPVIRSYFKKLTEQVQPGLVVLSFNELDNMAEVQSVGIVRG